MPSVKNIGTKTAPVYIPTDSDALVIITITADDDTVYTVMDTYGGAEADNHCISSPTLTRSATDVMGNFRLRIANDGGRFLDKFNGGEVVKIYSDATDATTLIFQGKIDNPTYGLSSSSGFFIDLNGRAYPEMIDETITGIEVAATADISLAGILNEFFSDVTLVFWNGTVWVEATYTLATDTVAWSASVPDFPTTLMNLTYQHKKGWTVIKEICQRAGLDCYTEYDGSKWTLRTFLVDTITNDDSNVAYGTNLLGMNGFGVDNNEVYNRVIVYGKTESDNILLLKSENDTTSQGNLWIKDRVFTATDLDTMDEVQDKADFELTKGIDADAQGQLTSVCLHTLRPGEIINCSVPYSNIEGTFKVQSFTHSFGNLCKTTLNLTKKTNTLKDIFVAKVNPDDFVGAIDNPNNMTDSYTVYFNENPSKVNHTNTVEVDGRIRLQDGFKTGTTTSVTLTTDQDVETCELRRFENYETVQDSYEVSNTNGATWETYATAAGSEVHTFDVAANKLKFRLRLVRSSSGDTSPSYESIALLYK